MILDFYNINFKYKIFKKNNPFLNYILFLNLTILNRRFLEQHIEIYHTI